MNRKRYIDQYKTLINNDQVVKASEFAMSKLTAKDKEKIKASFEKNKEKIMKGSFDMSESDAYRVYMESIANKSMQKDISVGESSKAVLRSRAYTTKYDMLRENVISGIRSDRAAYENWRKLTQHKKINFENMRYIGDNQYVYTMPTYEILIDFHNSPKEVRISKYEKPTI